MNRIHIHISVEQLAGNIKFYSALFAVPPSIVHEDYAKWVLDDPSVNFAISNRGHHSGLNHLGIQVGTDEELEQIAQRFNSAEIHSTPQKNASCCYANSNKYWSVDPQGIAWESFHTISESATFACGNQVDDEDESSACCIPLHIADSNQKLNTDNAACCGANNETTSGHCC